MPSFEFKLPTREQLEENPFMVQAIDHDDPIMVTGVPGSGKTTVSIFRLRRLGVLNKQVALFTFTRMLRVAIRALAEKEGHSGKNVWTLHSWYEQQIRNYIPRELARVSEDVFNEEWALQRRYADQSSNYNKKEKLAELNSTVVKIRSERVTLISLSKAEVKERIKEYLNVASVKDLKADAATIIHKLGLYGLSEHNYDEVLIDEAQDLKIHLFKALGHFFENVSIAADDAQQLYNISTTEEDILDALQNEPAHYELAYNHRNTYEIYNFARCFVPENTRAQNSETLRKIKEKNSIKGSTPNVIIISNEEKELEMINDIIEDNQGSNIGILFHTPMSINRYHKKLSNKWEVSKYHSEMKLEEKKSTEENLNNLLITTYRSAKGLEFDIVILPRFNYAREEDKNHHFVGSTRAISKLFLLCIGELPPVLEGAEIKETYQLTRY